MDSSRQETDGKEKLGGKSKKEKAVNFKMGKFDKSILKIEAMSSDIRLFYQKSYTSDIL